MQLIVSESLQLLIAAWNITLELLHLQCKIIEKRKTHCIELIYRHNIQDIHPLQVTTSRRVCLVGMILGDEKC